MKQPDYKLIKLRTKLNNSILKTGNTQLIADFRDYNRQIGRLILEIHDKMSDIIKKTSEI